MLRPSASFLAFTDLRLAMDGGASDAVLDMSKRKWDVGQESPAKQAETKISRFGTGKHAM